MKVDLFGWRTMNETFFKVGTRIAERGIDRDDLYKVYACCPKHGGMISSEDFTWVDKSLHFVCMSCGNLHKVDLDEVLNIESTIANEL